MSEIVPFNFDGNRVRVIIDLEGRPWWVASDVAAILGYYDASTAVRQHVRNHQKGLQELQTVRGVQKVLIVNEGGLYRLIMRSDKPDAERFQDWVTDEVLPTIRKTGSYSVTTTIPQTYAEALRAYADEVEAREIAEKKVAELEPAAEQFHRWQESTDTVHIVEWAKTIGLTQNQAHHALRECGVLFKQEHHDKGKYLGEYFNLPKRGYEKYFEVIDEYKPAPRRWVKVSKITAEGQVVLHELLVERGWVSG